MEWVETTGRTIEEAKEIALDQLGVDTSEAEFELVEEPKSGLFGRTRGVAWVRARVVPLTPPPKTERRRRKKGSDESGGQSRGGGQSSGGRGSESEGGRERTSARPKSQNGGGPKNDRGNRNDRGQGRGSSNEPREPMDPDEQKAVLEDFLVELARRFGLTATASSTLEENELTVNLEGDGLGFLVGPRLATLDAVQEVARNALQRQAAGREYAKIVVDVEGIRSRRRESLARFVTEAGEQVRADDVDVVFEVMSSADRKMVHDVASTLDGVSSSSEGEDPRRRVVLRKE